MTKSFPDIPGVEWVPGTGAFIKIDLENHRIGLSVRKVESPAYADLDWQDMTNEMVEDQPPAASDTEQPAADAA